MNCSSEIILKQSIEVNFWDYQIIYLLLYTILQINLNTGTRLLNIVMEGNTCIQRVKFTNGKQNYNIEFSINKKHKKYLKEISLL